MDWLLERLMSDPGVSLRYVSTKDQIADIFTKAMVRDDHFYLARLLGWLSGDPSVRDDS